MARKKLSVPSYRLHKPSGKAVVTLDGRDFYLGEYGSEESRRAYDRVVGEWQSNGRCLPEQKKLTGYELADAYWQHAKQYYRRNGQPTRTLETIRAMLKTFLAVAGEADVEGFGPQSLKTLREEMIRAGNSRRYINAQVNRVRHMFKWAAGEEIVSAGIHQKLIMVQGLRKGRTEAKERPPVKPVELDVVERTAAVLPPTVAAMVWLQCFTGARPDEVCRIRPKDVDRSGDDWFYRVPDHKTDHYNKVRVVCIAKRGQEVLMPYLLRPADAYCFSPRESEDARWAAIEERQDTEQPKKAVGKKKGRPEREIRDRYTTSTYRQVIHRAIEKANRLRTIAEDGTQLPPVPKWSPNQIRHYWATRSLREHGIEATQASLGHSRPETTLIYAQRSLDLAIKVARAMG